MFRSSTVPESSCEAPRLDRRTSDSGVTWLRVRVRSGRAGEPSMRKGQFGYWGRKTRLNLRKGHLADRVKSG